MSVIEHNTVTLHHKLIICYRPIVFFHLQVIRWVDARVPLEVTRPSVHTALRASPRTHSDEPPGFRKMQLRPTGPRLGNPPMLGGTTCVSPSPGPARRMAPQPKALASLIASARKQKIVISP